MNICYIIIQFKKYFMQSKYLKIGGVQQEIIGNIGEGAFASVHLVKDKQGNNYALKIIKNYNNEMIREMTTSQIKIQRQFKNSQRIIKFVDFEEESTKAYIVLELGECSLRNWIDSKNSLWQNNFINVICNVCAGIAQIHQKNVIHRDIKPQNIIKVGDVFKITDFGTSCQNDKEDGSLQGTPIYWAPQMLSDQIKNFTNKVDIWSLGVTMFEVYFKVHPFYPSKKLISDRKIVQEVQKNIEKLTPNFTIQKFLNFLKENNLEQQYRFVKKRAQRTNKELMDSLFTFFEPDPNKRPDIQLCQGIFQSLRQSIQWPKIPKTEFVKSISSIQQVPEDIRIFCNAKDFYYRLATFCEHLSSKDVVFALELGIWFLEGVNYGGKHFVKMECMDKIKNYKQERQILKKEIKDILVKYYFKLLSDDETISEFDQINQLKIYLLFCASFWQILDRQKAFIEQIQKITTFDIGYPLRIFLYLQLLTDKMIIDIEQFLIVEYLDLDNLNF